VDKSDTVSDLNLGNALNIGPAAHAVPVNDDVVKRVGDEHFEAMVMTISHVNRYYSALRRRRLISQQTP
jgi:hypothetical protein